MSTINNRFDNVFSLWLALGVLCATTAALHSQTAEDAATDWQRPGYQFLRHQEDWSSLKGRDTTRTGDLFDPIKHVPLSEDGSVWASFGGHLRLRVENWGHAGFGVPPNDNDTFALYRLTLHSDLHVGENLRFFVEGKTAQSSDRDLPGGRRASDVDSIALEQAFADLILPLGDGGSVTFRAGRQALLFGKQRLVSPLPWSNAMRRWDGAAAILRSNGWTVTAFYTQFAPVIKYDFNKADAQTQFFGVYATGKMPSSDNSLDLYWLALDRDDPVTFNGTTGSEKRHTLGGRTWGAVADTPLDWEIEGAYQFGEVGAGDIAAYMIAAELGYTVSEGGGAPRLHVGFDYATGDESTGGDVETFNQLFPLGHAYLGWIDAIGRQNIIDLSTGVTLKPIDRMVVKLIGHFFWQADDADALYNAGSGAGSSPSGGGVFSAAAPGSDDEVGQEVDLLVKYTFDRHTTGTFGYSRFFAGDRLEAGAATQDIDFFYLMLQYTF